MTKNNSKIRQIHSAAESIFLYYITMFTFW